MVKIRLFRTGAKHKVSYRIVAIESQKKRNGKPLEVIGVYEPRNKPPTIKVKTERLKYWLSKGAQMSEVVKRIVQNEKTS
jgi:small subunit ribosomal protein S16